MEDIEKLILPYTGVSPVRVHALHLLAQQIEEKGIPGDVVECGVWNGGSAALLAATATRSQFKRTVWLLDSFEGFPACTEKDGVSLRDNLVAKEFTGKIVGNIQEVKDVLTLVGADTDQVKILPGWFKDTLPRVTSEKIALLNIDADWYASVKEVLEALYDRVVPGGFVSFDDYGFWPGCRAAVDEFVAARKLNFVMHDVDLDMRWFCKERS